MIHITCVTNIKDHGYVGLSFIITRTQNVRDALIQDGIKENPVELIPDVRYSTPPDLYEVHMTP